MAKVLKKMVKLVRKDNGKESYYILLDKERNIVNTNSKMIKSKGNVAILLKENDKITFKSPHGNGDLTVKFSDSFEFIKDNSKFLEGEKEASESVKKAIGGEYNSVKGVIELKE